MLIMLYQAKKQHSGIGQSLDWYGSETVPPTDTRKQRVLGCKPNQSSCSRFTQAILHPPSCSSVLMSLKTMFSCSYVLKNMFFCSPVLSPQAIPMFFCLITMHIFLVPIKILNCFSLPFQISFILLYINILSLRKIENSIYTFYRNGTSTL